MIVGIGLRGRPVYAGVYRSQYQHQETGSPRVRGGLPEPPAMIDKKGRPAYAGVYRNRPP